MKKEICVFCKREPEVVKISPTGLPTEDKYFVQCASDNTCRLQINTPEFKTEKSAVTSWNNQMRKL